MTVPGACAGWCDLVDRHGSLPLRRILAPAIALARLRQRLNVVASIASARTVSRLADLVASAELKLEGARRFQAEFEHGISSRQNSGGGNSGGAGSQVRICNIQVIAGTPVGPAKFSLERKRVGSTLGGRSRGERQSGLQAAETFLPL